MSKVERKYLAHFINIKDADKGDMYERLGKDLEEYSMEMNAQVDRKKNILGEEVVMITGYEKSASVQTYYADPNTMLYRKLQQIIEQAQTLEQLKVEVLEVRLWETVSNNAVREDAYIEVLSYGGDTTGYQIPFKLHYAGNRTSGVFDMDSMTFSDK